MLTRNHCHQRGGTATVEAAIVISLVVFPLLVGIWEMGWVVHAQQVVSNAAREGARLAAQGRTISQTDGAHEVTIADVKNAVYQAIVTGGLTGIERADVHFEFTFIAPYGQGGLGPVPTEPHHAEKLQQFRITASIPYSKIRVVNLGLVHPDRISYQVDWFMLVDDRFRINDTIPAW